MRSRHWTKRQTGIAPAFAVIMGLMVGNAAIAQFEQPVADAAGADAVRLAIKRGLAQFAESIPEDINLVLQGPVDVAVEGGTYAARLPALSLRTNEDGDDFELSLGPTNSVLEPLGQNRLSAAIDLSEQLIGSRNDKTTFTVDWVTRIAQATFNADLGFAESIKIALDQIKAIDFEDGSTVIDIAEMTLDGSYGDVNSDRVDGTAEFVANQVRITPPREDQEMSVSRLTIGSDVQNFDVGRYEDYVDFSNRMTALHRSGDALSIEQAERVADELIQFLDIVDGMEQRASISDFWLTDEVDHGGIARASAAISVAGLTSQLVQFGFAGDIDGVDVPLEGEYDPFVPKRSQLKVALSSLPIDAVKDALHTGVVGVLIDADADDIGDALTDPLDTIMSSNATLDIESAIVELEDSAVFVDGQMLVDPQAAYGAIGQGSIRLIGLENLIEKVRNLPDGPQMAAFLAFLLAAGQQEEGADGMSVRRYEIELTSDGAALLNGADIGPLLEQLQ